MPKLSSLMLATPDFDGCGTYGDDLTEAYEMAREVMELMISGYNAEDLDSVPSPSDPMAIKTDDQSFISLIYSNFDPVACYIESRKAAKEEENDAQKN